MKTTVALLLLLAVLSGCSLDENAKQDEQLPLDDTPVSWQWHDAYYDTSSVVYQAKEYLTTLGNGVFYKSVDDFNRVKQ